MQEGESGFGRVLGTSLTNIGYKIASDAATWVSILECGTAAGRRLTPTIVFTGALLQAQWYTSGFKLEREFPQWKYDFAIAGWSNTTLR